MRKIKVTAELLFCLTLSFPFVHPHSHAGGVAICENKYEEEKEEEGVALGSKVSCGLLSCPHVSRRTRALLSVPLVSMVLTR